MMCQPRHIGNLPLWNLLRKIFIPGIPKAPHNDGSSFSHLVGIILVGMARNPMICIYRKYIYSKTELYIYFYIDNYIYDYINVYIIQVLNNHVLSSHLAHGQSDPRPNVSDMRGKKKTTPCLQDRSMSPTNWSLHLKTAKVGILKSKKITSKWISMVWFIPIKGYIKGIRFRWTETNSNPTIFGRITSLLYIINK